MTTTGTTAGAGGRRGNVVVAVVCGLAVLLVVVLALVLAPGRTATSAEAPTRSAEPWPPPPPPDPSPAVSAVPSPGPPVRSAAPPAPAEPSAEAATPVPVVPPPAPGPAPEPGGGAATPAPQWLGGRALAAAGSGPVSPQVTPPELLDRRVITRDLLPPPTGEAFDPQVAAVPADVLARSTWQPGCPVTTDELRYLRVQHWGFDDRLHTGELLVHSDAVEAVVSVFGAMHAERFPLEEVRVIRADELDAAPTGDGNVTSAFVCRPAVGDDRWSRHAYGLALDINPFHNPYDRGDGADRVVLPELATAYTDRGRALPGMLSAGSGAVRAAGDAGWGWGGDFRSLKDWMHLSDDGS